MAPYRFKPVNSIPAAFQLSSPRTSGSPLRISSSTQNSIRKQVPGFTPYRTESPFVGQSSGERPQHAQLATGADPGMDSYRWIRARGSSTPTSPSARAFANLVASRIGLLARYKRASFSILASIGCGLWDSHPTK